MDDLPSARALAYDMVYNGVEVNKTAWPFTLLFYGTMVWEIFLIRCLNL